MERKRRRSRQTQPTKPNAKAAERGKNTYTRHAGETDRGLDGQGRGSFGKRTKTGYEGQCRNDTYR